jgi:hypothetical protein
MQAGRLPSRSARKRVGSVPFLRGEQPSDSRPSSVLARPPSRRPATVL